MCCGQATARKKSCSTAICIAFSVLLRRATKPVRLATGQAEGPVGRFESVLFVQAAWVVLIKPKSWDRHGLKAWLEAAKKRLHHNVLAIALANKLACIAWSVLARGRVFEASRIQLRNQRVVKTSYLPRSARGRNEMEDRSSRPAWQLPAPKIPPQSKAGTPLKRMPHSSLAIGCRDDDREKLSVTVS